MEIYRGLRNVQKRRELSLELLVAGHVSRRKLLKYLKADERILKIVLPSYETKPLEYLSGLAHN